MRTYADTRHRFVSAGQTWHDMQGSGWVGISPLGARNVALAFSENSENLFYASPLIDDPEVMRRNPVGMIGGPGGDRLRFAPEYIYSWESNNHDFQHFSNYQVQEDPGSWQLQQRAHSVLLTMEVTLKDLRDGRPIRFRTEREILPTSRPLPRGSRYQNFAGYELRHNIEILEASPRQKVGLWNLLQEPPGSVLIVPTIGAPRPVSYFNKGDWINRADHLTWRYEGIAMAKLGLDADQMTGRTAVLRRMSGGELLLVVRQFPVRPDLYYCEGRREEESGKQAFHGFDGVGLGEMEFHSPAVGAPPLPERYSERSQLWAFDGDETQIASLANDLLGIDVWPDIGLLG